MAKFFRQILLKKRFWHQTVKPGLACLIWLLAGLGLHAQTVSGTVTSDNDRSPLTGASVLEKGTANGTVTGIDGTFSLKLSKVPATLEVSFIGFEKKNIAITLSEISP